MRVARSVGAAVQEQRKNGPVVLEFPKSRQPAEGGTHPSLPHPPAPPVPPAPPGRQSDVEKMARDLKMQIEKSIPRAGTLGLIAGARALERTDRIGRAEEILRRSRDPIARIELFLLQQKAGRPDAKAELRSFAKSVPPDEWPAPLLRAYLGEASDQAVLEAATGPEEECEAEYYLGRLHAKDDVDLARKHLEKATEEDCEQSQFAREDLALLQRR